MTPLERIKIIDDIGRELQSRMTYVEIDTYFSAYGIPTNITTSSNTNSKYVYVKEVLKTVNEDLIIQIANELDIQNNYQSKINTTKENSVTFWKIGHFKLFISHLASFKTTISALKNELEKYGISSFVAHEDIEPTLEWQGEIEKGLFTMDALCAVLMPKFKESNWTDQEIGVAIGRDVLVIPVRRDLDPYGFIGKYQGFQALGKNLHEVAEGIFMILARNPKTRNKLINCLTELFVLSNNKTDALNRIKSLNKIQNLPEDKIYKIRNNMVENKILKDKDVLLEVNRLFQIYNIESVQPKDFDKTNIFNSSDLPF